MSSMSSTSFAPLPSADGQVTRGPAHRHCQSRGGGGPGPSAAPPLEPLPSAVSGRDPSRHTQHLLQSNDEYT
jgi:hypothetical protein